MEEDRLRHIEHLLEKHDSQIDEMSDRNVSLMAQQKVQRRIAYSILSSVLALSAFVVSNVITNKNAVDELRRDNESHGAQGHPELREAVVEVRTEVRALTSSVDRLNDNIDQWRRTHAQDLMAGSRSTGDGGGWVAGRGLPRSQ